MSPIAEIIFGDCYSIFFTLCVSVTEAVRSVDIPRNAFTGDGEKEAPLPSIANTDECSLSGRRICRAIRAKFDDPTTNGSDREFDGRVRKSLNLIMVSAVREKSIGLFFPIAISLRLRALLF